MPELANITRSNIAIAAGRKTDPTTQNRVRTAIIETPQVYPAALNGDTFATGIVLAKGTRLTLPVSLSWATNAAAVTLSLGLRDAVTKVAVDPTAIVNAQAITTANTLQVNTGTKLNQGQSYTLPQDCEIYGTFGGGNPNANVAIRAEVSYVAP